RRHTRFARDWSSDVCSSDLVHPAVLGRGALADVSVVVHGPAAPVAARLACRDDVPFLSLTSGPHGLVAEVRAGSARDIDRAVARSEERRAREEWQSVWPPQR